jgi:hypothetical protein
MTSAIFPNRIGLDVEDDERHYTLTRDFIYNDEEKDIRVVVPAGFTTDFNSTPRAIWCYFAPWDHPEAGIIHDWLYGSPAGYTHQSGAAVTPLSRTECDQIHRRILDIEGVRWTKRQAVYAGLHAFSWKPWAEHRAQDVVGDVKIPHKSDPKSSV